MHEIGLPQVLAGIEAAAQAGDHAKVEALLWPALDQFPDLPQLWFYAGNVLFQTGRAALAVRALEYAAQLDEQPLVLANLGAAYRRLNRIEEGRRVLTAALERDPDYAPALTNMGSLYVNEGNPHAGIPYLERALSAGERAAAWNLALLYLEAGEFARGFDLYRLGHGHERMVRSYGSDTYGIPEPKLLEPDDPREGKTLIVWGEQGIGDELMFGTILEEARRDFGQVIFECHPRLERLHRAAHPGMQIFPTRKDQYITWPIEHQVRADYKAPIGDLAGLYRRSREDFIRAWERAGPTYRYNINEALEYRRLLELRAEGRPIVALATRGGVIQTARTYRTLRIPDVDYLFSQTDCLFVGVDYDDMLQFASYVQERHEDRYLWFPSIVQAWDYDHVAALLAACDLTVAVCQSVAHLSAGLGLPTRVLVPKRCAWRYGLEGEEWYWYPDPAVKLYRQSDPDRWREPLDRVIADIRALKRRTDHAEGVRAHA